MTKHLNFELDHGWSLEVWIGDSQKHWLSQVWGPDHFYQQFRGSDSLTEAVIFLAGTIGEPVALELFG